MANVDKLRKQAKLLIRWHRAGYDSVSGRIRNLPRYRNPTNVEPLAFNWSIQRDTGDHCAEIGV